MRVSSPETAVVIVRRPSQQVGQPCRLYGKTHKTPRHQRTRGSRGATFVPRLTPEHSFGRRVAAPEGLGSDNGARSGRLYARSPRIRTHSSRAHSPVAQPPGSHRPRLSGGPPDRILSPIIANHIQLNPKCRCPRPALSISRPAALTPLRLPVRVRIGGFLPCASRQRARSPSPSRSAKKPASSPIPKSNSRSTRRRAEHISFAALATNSAAPAHSSPERRGRATIKMTTDEIMALTRGED